jgi:hypothetical protein
MGGSLCGTEGVPARMGVAVRRGACGNANARGCGQRPTRASAADQGVRPTLRMDHE